VEAKNHIDVPVKVDGEPFIVGDKFNMSVVDLSKDKISEMLLSKQVNEQTIQQLLETLNTCEYAKYAPSSVTGDLNKVYIDTLELISQIEEQIKR
jgi:hypothetical protein